MIPSIAQQLAAAATQRIRGAEISPEPGPDWCARCTPERMRVLQLLVLDLIEAGGALTHRQIADALPHKSRNAWAHILGRLVEAGHVARQRLNPDQTGTRVQFVVTDAGRQLRAQLRQLTETTPTPTATHTEH